MPTAFRFRIFLLLSFLGGILPGGISSALGAATLAQQAAESSSRANAAYARAKEAARASKGLGTSMTKPLAEVQDVEALACTAEEVKPVLKPCKACGEVLEKWKKRLPKVSEVAVAQDNIISQVFEALSQKFASLMESSEKAAFGSSEDVANEGKAASEKRAANAETLSAQFKKCREEIEKTCKELPDGEDKKKSDEMKEACEQGEAAAGDFAKQRLKDGLSLSDIGKNLDTATKLLGAASQLAQLMNGKNSGGSGSAGAGNGSLSGNSGIGGTSPTPSSLSSGSELSSADVSQDEQSTKLKSNDKSAGTGQSALGKSLSGTNLQTGKGSPSASSEGDKRSSSGADRSLASAGADPFGRGGAAEASGSGKFPGGGSDAGGSGSVGAGGASQSPDDSVAVTNSRGAENGYEVGGGGGFKAMVGLKPSKEDLADLTDDKDLTGADPVDSKDENGLGDFSGEQSAGGTDVLSADSQSIFARVKTRYGALNRNGRI